MWRNYKFAWNSCSSYQISDGWRNVKRTVVQLTLPAHLMEESKLFMPITDGLPNMNISALIPGLRTMIRTHVTNTKTSISKELKNFAMGKSPALSKRRSSVIPVPALTNTLKYCSTALVSHSYLLFDYATTNIRGRSRILNVLAWWNDLQTLKT